MKKVTKLPIGLGMNHLEQEIAACQLYNRASANGDPRAWMSKEGLNPDLFRTNQESGLSLFNCGFILITEDTVRLTRSAVTLIENFIDQQQ